MYLDQLGTVLYLHDRPHLDRDFAEMGEKGWAASVSGEGSGPNPLRDQARAIQLMPYGVGDAASIGVHAARDFQDDARAGLLPEWVYEIAPLGLIAAINRTNPREVRHDDRRRRGRQRKRTG